MRYDILIIGAGVLGSFIARKLSAYDVSVALLDKESDVGNVTSMANSAIIHSGYDPVPGTNKAKFNVLGNKMYDQIADELDVHFRRIGSMTVALYDEQLKVLKELEERSKENGVEVRLLSKEEALKMEPNLSPEVKGALYAPTAGIIDPFNLVVHCVENAVDNGVNLLLNSKVIKVEAIGDGFKVSCKDGKEYECRVLVDAAGLASDKIASMLEEIDWKITPRKGQYYVLDHFDDNWIKHTIFPLPSEKGKGILVSPTSSNNYILGPSSELVDSIDDLSTDGATLREVKRQALEMVPSIPFYRAIRAFAGNRATCTRHDFVIERGKKHPNFVILGGIESPGLVSSPAIAEYVVEELIKKIIELNEKKDFNPRVRRYRRLKDMSFEDREKLIKEDPDYGKIVCFCEKVSLGEVKDALSRSVAPHSIKAMKKRVRAGFGKCQGGFCQSNILKEIAEHFDLDWMDICYDGQDSQILIEDVKEPRQ